MQLNWGYLPQPEGYSQSQNNIGSMEQPSSQRSLN